MANARSRFDTIAGYLQRTHEARAGQLYGRPCLMWQGHAFAVFQLGAMAFRVHGRSLAQALALPGARGWDPAHPDRAAPGWVLIPVEQVLRWDRLALDAVRCASEASERRVSYAVAPAPAAAAAPPPSNPGSLAQRFASAVAAGFRSFTLSKVDR
jgi:hypothetical protein